MKRERSILSLSAIMAALILSGCAVSHPPAEVRGNAHLTPASPVARELSQLPEPAGRIAVAVYGFRDQTGQYKPAPDSSFSTAVTQGGTALLVKTLKDSGWFIPVERENLQNLLTERKIIRALETPQAADAEKINVPSLLSASLILEGGVVAYESNVRTGGVGAKYLGVGLSTQYRVDQVTVNVRAVNSRNGEIIHSISTTKTIYSYEVRPSVFKFVNFKDLVEFEAGMTRNEPAQLCVAEAIEAAVMHLVASGIKSRSWSLKNPNDVNHPILKKYWDENARHLAPEQVAAVEMNEEDWAGSTPEQARIAANQRAMRTMR
ncbi:CsgG/HfaB family protein [Noviherbaspirillum aerium]|uniref:CsgG/HfaB family protein n=1 Tax=Noviherbaspirillum aerium TaxID=2588497 RepID=UPI00124E6D2C|nr:CsgG/HfaB family protein [Noviherbaspirillum aerium]